MAQVVQFGKRILPSNSPMQNFPFLWTTTFSGVSLSTVVVQVYHSLSVHFDMQNIGEQKKAPIACWDMF